MGKDWKNFETNVRKSLDCLKQTVGRNAEQGSVGEVSEDEVVCYCNLNRGQNAELTCILQLYGKQNLQALNVDI